MQKFFTNTIEGKFIKSLIYNTPIPLLNVVTEGDYIVKNVLYIYKTSVIECTESGYIRDFNENEEVNDILPSNELKATFKRVKDFIWTDNNPLITENYKSKFKYYDSITHYYLGEYLRAYRAIYNINLLPFYNCFNYTVLSTFYLNYDNINKIVNIENSSNDKYKILAIPIKFNRTYTIAIDSDSPVLIRGLFYNDLGLIKKDMSKESSYWYESISDKGKKYSNLNFKRPITYQINTDDSKLMQFEKYLYLAIQVNANNTSGIVVLEGAYRNLGIREINYEYIAAINDQELNNYYLSPLSLLQINDGNQYAFSDRLIDYLLLNVITPQDEISDNIKRIQNYLANNQEFILTSKDTKGIENQPNYITSYKTLLSANKATRGVWDDKIREILYKIYKEKANYPFIDINGFVDKNMELFINKL